MLLTFCCILLLFVFQWFGHGLFERLFGGPNRQINLLPSLDDFVQINEIWIGRLRPVWITFVSVVSVALSQLSEYFLPNLSALVLVEFVYFFVGQV